MPIMIKKKFRKTGKNNPRYRLWKMQVSIRDGDSCLSCDTKEQVCVFSIVKYQDEELLYDMNNGISLCTNCHKYILSGNDFEWICRCLIMDRKLNAKQNNRKN